MPRVFIIILNWNGWKDTVECVESLKKVDYPNFEIVIVDNGSTDESVKEIKSRFIDPKEQSYGARVVFFETGANLGFAGGNNFGIEKVKDLADYILLLNNDTTVAPDFLKILIKEGENTKDVGILSSRINFYTHPEFVWFDGGKVNFLKTKGKHLRYNTKENEIKEPFFCDFVTGCAPLIKKAVIEKIGLMDESYFLYFEDVDWCLRVKKAGYKLMLVPQSKIWHKVSRSSKPGSFNYIYYNIRNSFYMGSKFSNFFTLPLIYFLSFIQFAKEIVKLAFPAKRTWARASMKGIWDFWRGRMGEI